MWDPDKPSNTTSIPGRYRSNYPFMGPHRNQEPIP
jgi:hypothetical protein